MASNKVVFYAFIMFADLFMAVYWLDGSNSHPARLVMAMPFAWFAALMVPKIIGEGKNAQ